jgi:hypothetical protein
MLLLSGDAHAAVTAISFNGRELRSSVASLALPFFQSRAAAVGHEEESLSGVRCAHARSRQIGRPDGVAPCFQVSRNSVEPSEASRACNLLAKDDWRAELADEPVHLGPEVSGIGGSFALAGGGEGLAGAAAGEDGAVIGPSGEAERVAPAADAGEEVDLGVAAEILRGYVHDAPLVDVAGGDEPFVN